MYRYDARNADCRVYTWRDGLLSGFGHDLELGVTHFAVEVDDRARTVVARFDPASLKVLAATRNGAPTPLGPADRARIERAIADEVLHAVRYPEIRFTSSEVEDVGTGGFRATGKLALHGRERLFVVPVQRDDDRYIAETRLQQPDFGIAPYSAMLGTLRVKPEVVVRVVMPVLR